MRRVVAVELVSVDSVMESPEEGAFPYSNDEMGEASASGMAASDALLWGGSRTSTWLPTGPTSRAARRCWTS